LHKIDLAELFICSASTLNNQNIKFDNVQKDEKAVQSLKIIVSKAEGTKCTHCWKVLPNKCDRINCGIV
jgi:isoleucyl-tRNA synthetase